ncbi:MAG: hypothetical protein M3Y23_04935, partial [Actinomycetota bacterium]|nr:hypothetical protein [Actinomycetota bacterium]
VVTGLGTIPDTLIDVAVPPLNLLARCRFPDVPVNFSTANYRPFTAEPFKGGFGVKGAMTTSWTSLPPVVSENGGECDLLETATAGGGGIWLSNGIDEPGLLPVDPSCETDPALCPPEPAANITALRLSPKKRSLRAGKVARMKVRVTNTGDAATTGVRIKVRSSNRKVKVRRSMVVNVPAGTTATRTIKVRALRHAKGKARIRVRAAGLKATSNLKIRKLAARKRQIR